MSSYIEAVNEYTPLPGQLSVFLAGGISNCPRWQFIMNDWFQDELNTGLPEGVLPVAVVNPRRESFNTLLPEETHKQIEWEFYHLRKCSAVLFWFPKETLCPITLFELGAWSMQKEIPIFVGVDPEYARKEDVVIQLSLVRPQVTVVFDLGDLKDQVVAHFKTQRSLMDQ